MLQTPLEVRKIAITDDYLLSESSITRLNVLGAMKNDSHRLQQRNSGQKRII